MDDIAERKDGGTAVASHHDIDEGRRVPCARSVHEWSVFNQFGLVLNGRQTARFVENACS